MKKILIITSADMSLQSGNVVLVIRRAKEIYRQYHIETVCVTYHSRQNGVEVTHQEEGVEFLYAKNKEQLHELLEQQEYCAVIFYGGMTLLSVSYVKRTLRKLRRNTAMIMDLQGCVEEQIEYPGDIKGIERIKNTLSFHAKMLIYRRTMKKIDGVIVVTDELAEYCREFLPEAKREKLKTFKIRCGINEIIPNESRLRWREEIRSKWNIVSDTTVMVFSGYRLPWQKIDEIIEYFQTCEQKDGNVFFAFFCNIDAEFENKLKEAFPRGNYVLQFLKFDDYYKHLCACDVGFLMRDRNVTNKVAFPNKFSDYLNAGLLIAINDALPEPVRLLKSYDISYVDLDNTADDILLKCRSRRADMLAYYAKCDEISLNELLFDRQITNSNIRMLFMESGQTEHIAIS